MRITGSDQAQGRSNLLTITIEPYSEQSLEIKIWTADELVSRNEERDPMSISTNNKQQRSMPRWIPSDSGCGWNKGRLLLHSSFGAGVPCCCCTKRHGFSDCSGLTSFSNATTKLSDATHTKHLIRPTCWLGFLTLLLP